MAGTEENLDLQFGRFKVSRILGRGGMGKVYLAEDPVIGRKVAIKVVSAEPGLAEDDLEEIHARFEREFQSAGSLAHPNIVTVYDVGTEGDDTFIAMEFLPGDSWGDILKSERALSFGDVADFAAKICSALDYAHASGIVHRDIKPANILVARNGEPKVTDFGVAKLTSTNLTRTGTVVGTPSYMSPEQITGGEVSGASDQFSVGVILYQMLTGTLPFSGENPTTILYKIVHDTPPTPCSKRQSLPEALDIVLMKSLEKKPEDRYADCSVLAAALREALGVVADTMDIEFDQTAVLGRTLTEGIISPRAKKKADAKKKKKEKGRGGLIAALAAVVLVAAGAGLYFTGMLDQLLPQSAPEPVVEEGPVQITQMINVSSDETGASIVVNGSDTGLVAPAEVPLQGLEGDELMLELQRDGKTVAKTSLLLAATMPPEWVAVEEIPPETFLVTSTPPGAEVYLNEELVAGLTPTEIDLLAEEKYALRVQLPEYIAEGVTFTFPVDLAESIRQSHRFTFALKPRTPPGRIVIQAPYSVRVEVAGQTYTGRSHDITARPDTYRIRLSSAEVFLDETRTVSVDSQDLINLSVPPAVELRVTASPANCRVYVNGKFIDETPFNVSLVPAPGYEFRFEWQTQGETRTQLVNVTRDSDRVRGSLDDP